jgi:hypothetical protein
MLDDIHKSMFEVCLEAADTRAKNEDYWKALEYYNEAGRLALLFDDVPGRLRALPPTADLMRTIGKVAEAEKIDEEVQRLRQKRAGK